MSDTRHSNEQALSDARVAVVIVNYRTPDLTRACLKALSGERKHLPHLKAMVVDGGSSDDSAKKLGAAVAEPEFKDWVTFLPLPINGGFGWANNQAILTLARQADSPEFIHLLNPDAQVKEGAVAALVRELRAHVRCGAAGSQLLNADGSMAASAFKFPSPGRELLAAAQSEKLGRIFGIHTTVVDTGCSTEVDWVTGASFMLRSQALRDSGLFDDGFFLYFEEVELMHRLRSRGWSVRHVPESRVMHLEGASTGLGASAASRPFPPYWYQSRRRYFALTGGRAALFSGTFATLLGRGVLLAKQLAGKRPQDSSLRMRDLFESGLWASRSDLRPSAPAWGDPPGRSPAWQQQS